MPHDRLFSPLTGSSLWHMHYGHGGSQTNMSTQALKEEREPFSQEEGMENLKPAVFAICGKHVLAFLFSGHIPDRQQEVLQ